MSFSLMSARLRVALLALLALAGAACWLHNRTPAIASVGEVPASVIRPLLAEDWKQVVRVDSGPCCGHGSSPVMEMIRAHALVATNQSTDAACILLGVTERNLAAWLTWTAGLLRRYPNEPVAHLLRGDALARRQRYDEAIAEYTQALQLHPHDALALDGRGQVYAALRDWNHAIDDLDFSSHANPHLADGLANRGWVFIQRKTGAPGAVDCFNRALQVEPNFSMARHGRGCAELALGQMAAGKSDFEAPVKAGDCTSSLVRENALEVAAFLRGMTRDQLLASLGKEPGTTLTTKFAGADDPFRNWKSNPTQHNFNGLVYQMNSMSHREQQSFIHDVFDQALAHNSDLADKARQQSGRVENWNTGLGGMIGHIVGGFTEGGGAALLTLGKHPLVITGGVLMMGAGHITEEALTQASDRNLKTAQMMGQASSILHGASRIDSGNPIGGVDVSLDGARIDDGEWPFSAYFGLLYQPLEQKGKSDR